MTTQKPHGHRLRTGRYSETGRSYLLTTVTHQRRRIFSNFQAARILTQCLRHHHEGEEIHSLAFVIMPDHLHWLVQLQSKTTLHGLMRSFKGYSAKMLQNLLPSVNAPIWQRGYHDHAVRSDEDLKALARYVIANPLRAGLVSHIGEYPHWDAAWL